MLIEMLRESSIKKDEELEFTDGDYGYVNDIFDESSISIADHHVSCRNVFAVIFCICSYKSYFQKKRVMDLVQ